MTKSGTGSSVAAILVVQEEQTNRLTAMLANLDTEEFVPNRATPGLTVIQAKDRGQK